MKTYFTIFFAFLWLSLNPDLLWSAPGAITQPAPSQIKDVPSPTPLAVTQRDANVSVWERTVYELDASGRAVGKIHGYTELASGLNHLVNGQWVDSKEWIDILPNGTAQAVQGQHQAYFPGDIFQGQIELVTAEGIHLKSRPLGLNYFDGQNSVLFAELTNSIGVVVGDNQVIYRNAFTGIKADLRYTYTKAGFEQDVILRQQPPTPESLGLNPDTARLQVLTEFFSPPQPAIQYSKLAPQAGLSLTDESLAFGTMQMVPGRAFLLGSQAAEATAQVNKQWVMLDGRQFLVEEVPVDAIVEGLAALPLTSMNSSPGKHTHTAARHLPLPPQRLAKNNTAQPILLARSEPSAPGYVLDYQTLNSSVTNYTFQRDTTYYVSSTVYLSGTNTLEGGTVIKFARSAGELCINYNTATKLNCLTAPYRPAVFTAVDDNSLGETISGSTGSPTNYYGNYNGGLFFDGAAPVNLHDIRLSYLNQGIYFKDESNYTWTNNNLVTDAQFVKCGMGIGVYEETVRLYNGLMAGCGTGFSGNGTAVGCVVNTTFAGSGGVSGGGSLYVTNCLIVGNTNGVAGGANNQFFSSGSGVFQAVGGGGYYLATNCPAGIRNAGTTNIDAALLADLAIKTTYPPIIYTNKTFTIATNFAPQAQRNTNAPDLGYHYDPLDYAFGGCTANSNITFAAGTAAGWFVASGVNSDGLALLDGVTANLNGLVSAPVVWARLNTVQERDLSAGSGPGGMTTYGFNSGTPYIGATINANFAHCFLLANGGNHFRDDDCCYDGHLFLIAKNCELYGNSGGYNVTLTYSNCLIFRSSVGLQSDVYNSGLTLQNCTVYSHNSYDVYAEHWGTSTWPVRILNCTFENADLHDLTTNNLYCDYNAFRLGDQRLPTLGSHDVLVTNGFNWQTSWLGNFYLPTNSALLNAGSTNANYLGLYHFTTQTNQTKEANSIVDIGYHYVAVDTNGTPIDSNGDGVFDYIADANGNGLNDVGETRWSLAIIVQPSSRTVYVGDNTTFSLTALGAAPLYYQWYFNGTGISGATNATLMITDVQTNNAGNYSIIVSNYGGSITSSLATLTVLLPNYMVPFGSLTNFTFQSDTTYFINTALQLYGTTTIEGGTVIKYANQPAAQIILNGPLACLTGPYRPALLTSKDDVSAGGNINGTTGNPTNGSAPYLVGGGGQTNDYRYLHIKYASIGISASNAVNVWDSQFVQGGTAVSGVSNGLVAFHNVLISQTTNCVITAGSVVAEFITVDQCQSFCPVLYNGANLTNSILTGVANTNGVNLVASVSLTNGSAVYQIAGGGCYYLANDTYQHMGSTNINPRILADIAIKTTRAPIIYNVPEVYFYTDLYLYPQAERDINSTPDLGYHYDPLDYILGSMYVTNATITINPGTAIGIYSTNGYTYGLAMADNSTLICSGAADNLAHIAQYLTVQERAAPGWVQPSYALVGHFNGNNIVVNCSFTDWSVLAQDVPHIQMVGLGTVNFKNCQFHGGYIVSGYPTFNFTNCLFERVNCDIEMSDDIGSVFRNNLVYGGTFGYYTGDITNAIIKDNLFDRAAIPDWIGGFGGTYDGGHNAYVTNCDLLDPAYTNDVILASPLNYQTGPLGSYYQPTNSLLINKGSTTADQVGLYHFTTQTNQVKEDNSVVDIGYHYVALDTNGVPVDSNGDGITDYLDDANGNGLVENWENNWALGILTQPADQSAYPGSNATFSVTTAGMGPLVYQWYFGTIPLTGATNSVLTLTNVQITNAGCYYVGVLNGLASVNSSVAILTVLVGPSIFSQPTNQAVVIGQSVIFRMGVTGTSPMSYQWFFNSIALDGATDSTLTLNNVQTNYAGNYQVIISNIVGSATSAVASLTILIPPFITLQPTNQTVVAGQSVSFGVAAGGWAPLYYQWYSNSVALIGASNTNLVLSNASTSDMASYSVVVTNAAGSVTSSIVNLTVTSLISDQDYDGRNNGQEITDGTDPFNPNSVVQVRLGYWRFDDTNAWAGDAGQLPLVATNVVDVLSWSTNAVQLDTTNPAILSYRDVETNGNANINLRNGTIRFWFKPDWVSTNMGGTGPGSSGRLIELGNYCAAFTNGWWSLYFSPDGCRLSFGSSTNGAGVVNLSAGIAWMTNQWHQVVLTYSPTNSILYVDGQYLTNGQGSLYFPNAAERTAGFRIGSDANGTNQAGGAFDELETFNYSLAAGIILTNYQAVSQWSTGTNGLPNVWQINNFGYVGVDPNGDPDGDYLSNLQEFQHGTNPNNPDTDGDGRTDWQEVMDGTDPLNPNSKATWLVRADQPNVNYNAKTIPSPSLIEWSQGGNWYFGVTNAAANVFYDVYSTSDFINWAWYGKIAAGGQYLLIDPTKAFQFYLLGGPLDSDGDGLTDAYEYFITHTDYNNPDSDYDGRSDGQEALLDGTNPNDVNSVTNVMMGYWRFDNTNTWIGTGGQLPMSAVNIIGLPSWGTNAVRIDTGTTGILKYHDVEPASFAPANINCRQGTVQFWFVPDWNSGMGPGSSGRLIEIGSQTSTTGWWSLYLNSSGTQLSFGTQTNGLTLNNLTAPINWVSNCWHQIVLTYSPTNSSLYLDGQLIISNGLGVTYFPNSGERANGIYIGSDSSGNNQGRGSFEELQTFNYPLNATNVVTNYQTIMLQDNNGNGMSDLWEMQNFGYIGVDPNGDPDGDGLGNLQEYKLGTNPNSFDSDGDGMSDGLEIELGRNPLVKEPNYIWFAPLP